MALTVEKGIALARAHAEAERRGDLVATLATLEPDPLYELFPIGRAFRGMNAARVYYEHFMANVRGISRGSELHGEWVSERGLAQEYTVSVRAPDGSEEGHRVVAIFTFGTTALAGERVYASERFLRFLFGPAFDLASPL
jgi:hypothetical protein